MQYSDSGAITFILFLHLYIAFISADLVRCFAVTIITKTHTDTCIHTYIHSHTYIYAYTHTNTHTHTHTRTYILSNTLINAFHMLIP